MSWSWHHVDTNDVDFVAVQMCAWSRYWMGLWKTFLVYFPARCLRGSSREAVCIRTVCVYKFLLSAFFSCDV